jgi:hypothetical protein
MSQRPIPGADGSTDLNEGLLIAESTPVADLPGLFGKTVVVGPEETGFLTSNGSVLRELPSGPHKVGWSVLGWGSGGREAVKIHNRPFGIRLEFSNLLSKGYEALDGIIHVTVSMSAPSLFFSTVLRGMEHLTSSQLGSALGAGISDLIQVKVTENDGQALRHDKGVQDSLMRDLEPHLKRVMEERGLTLQSVDLVAFNNPEEGGELLDELTEVEDLIARGVKPGREDIQSLLTRLRTIGIATPEMAERAQLLFDGGTNDAFFGVMRDINTASRRRLEARVVNRSERLSNMMNIQESRGVAAAAREKVLGLVGPICAAVGVVVKVVTTSTEGWFVLVGCLAAGVLALLVYVMLRAKRLLGKRQDGEIVIRLDKWAKKNSMATDDLIRRQMGREFSNSLADVKDAKLAAFKQEKKSVADSLGELENRMDLLRTEVESAPAASTIVSANGFPTKRISRMVSFEEEMLRDARNLSIRSQTAKETLADEEVEALRIGLDNFQRTFSKRIGMLEGFKEL